MSSYKYKYRYKPLYRPRYDLDLVEPLYLPDDYYLTPAASWWRWYDYSPPLSPRISPAADINPRDLASSDFDYQMYLASLKRRYIADPWGTLSEALDYFPRSYLESLRRYGRLRDPLPLEPWEYRFYDEPWRRRLARKYADIRGLSPTSIRRFEEAMDSLENKGLLD